MQNLSVACLAVFSFLIGCVGGIPLENRPCPCTAGWVCCDANICVREESLCATLGAAAEALAITPEEVTLSSEHSQTFSANRPATWAIVEEGAGEVSAEGEFVAPEKPGTYHLIATGKNGQRATATITVKERILELLAGSIGGPGTLDGTALEARFFSMENFAVDRDGKFLYIADQNRLRRVDLSSNEVSTVAVLASPIRNFALDSAQYAYVLVHPSVELAGLQRIDLATGQLDPVSTDPIPGAGFEVVVESDDRLLLTSQESGQTVLRKISLADGSVRVAATYSDLFFELTSDQNGRLFAIRGYGAEGEVVELLDDGTFTRFPMAGIGLASALAVFDNHLFVHRQDSPRFERVAISNGEFMCDGTFYLDDAFAGTNRSIARRFAIDFSGRFLTKNDLGIRRTALALPPSGGCANLQVQPAGNLLVGNMPLYTGFTDGREGFARFRESGITALLQGKEGLLYIGDESNWSLRTLDLSSHAVSTLVTIPSQDIGKNWHTIVGLINPADPLLLFWDGASPYPSLTTLGAQQQWSVPAGAYAPISILYRRYGAAVSDGAQVIYFSDDGGNRIRAYDRTSGEATTLLTVGDGPHGQTWELFQTGLAYEPGALFFSNQYLQTIQKRDLATGAITLVAGSERQLGYENGVGADARFSFPFILGQDRRYLYIQEHDGVASQRPTLRRVNKRTGEVSPFLGTDGQIGVRLGSRPTLSQPSALAVTAQGDLVIADEAALLLYH